MLTDVLEYRDSDYFFLADIPLESWISNFAFLKRLLRLMIQYLSDVLGESTMWLTVPDLLNMAQNCNMEATLSMCRLALAIGVRCENNAAIISKIQDLDENKQYLLKSAIEKVSISKLLANASQTDVLSRL